VFQSGVLVREARKIAVVRAPIKGIGTRIGKNPFSSSTNQGYRRTKQEKPLSFKDQSRLLAPEARGKKQKSTYSTKFDRNKYLSKSVFNGIYPIEI